MKKGQLGNWVWIAGALIAGFAIFVMGFRLFNSTLQSSMEMESLNSIQELKENINSLCFLLPGNSLDTKIKLFKNIEGVFASSTKKPKIEDLKEKVISSESSFGNYLCIKLKGKKVQCEKVDCNFSMPYLGYLPPEFSLSSLINQLLNKAELTEFSLVLERKENRISIHKK